MSDRPTVEAFVASYGKIVGTDESQRCPECGSAVLLTESGTRVAPCPCWPPQLYWEGR